MSIVTRIENMVTRHRQRQKEQGTDFPALVRQVVDGTEPPAEVVERILFESQKTFDDLKAAAEMLKRRRKWRAQYDSLPELQKQCKELESQIATANKALETAEKRHYQEVMPLRGQLSHLRQSASEGESARQRLWETCIDPELVAELNEVLARCQHAAREVSALNDAASQWRQRKKNELAAADAASRMIAHDHVVKQHQAQAKAFEAKAVECEAQKKPLEKKIAEFNRREEKIREQMLAP